MFCINCGKQLVDGAYACPYCGNVVENIAAKPADQPTASTGYISQETPPAYPQAPAPEPPKYDPYSQQPYNPYSQPQYNPYNHPQYNPYNHQQYNPYNYQPQYNPQPRQQAQPARTLPLTIVGFVFAFVFAPVGLILSLIAKSKMRKNPSLAGCRGMNKAAIIISIIITAYFAFIFSIAILAAISESLDSTLFITFNKL